jgi:hypothetical protein
VSTHFTHSIRRAAVTGLALILAALPAGGAARAADPDMRALTDEGKAVMTAFGGALKAELQAAMKEGGPLAAITVCNDRARPIATAVAADSGWSVGRSSHKVRYPGNAPDVYEQAVIDDFLARQAAGAAADSLVHTAVVETPDGGRSFRLIKAIPTDKVCLTCHGEAIAPEVADKLDALYPLDQARGFREGEMRGIFTLAKPL